MLSKLDYLGIASRALNDLRLSKTLGQLTVARRYATLLLEHMMNQRVPADLVERIHEHIKNVYHHTRERLA